MKIGKLTCENYGYVDDEEKTSRLCHTEPETFTCYFLVSLVSSPPPCFMPNCVMNFDVLVVWYVRRLEDMFSVMRSSMLWSSLLET